MVYYFSYFVMHWNANEFHCYLQLTDNNSSSIWTRNFHHWIDGNNFMQYTGGKNNSKQKKLWNNQMTLKLIHIQSLRLTLTKKIKFIRWEMLEKQSENCVDKLFYYVKLHLREMQKRKENSLNQCSKLSLIITRRTKCIL